MEEMLREVYADKGRREKEIIGQINDSCQEKWDASTKFLIDLTSDGSDR